MNHVVTFAIKLLGGKTLEINVAFFSSVGFLIFGINFLMIFAVVFVMFLVFLCTCS